MLFTIWSTSRTIASDSSRAEEQEKILDGKITKAIDKQKYYLELKLNCGNTRQREIRQWKRDLKASYAPLQKKQEKIYGVLENIEKKLSMNLETENLTMKFDEEKFRMELQEREKAI